MVFIKGKDPNVHAQINALEEDKVQFFNPERNDGKHNEMERK